VDLEAQIAAINAKYAPLLVDAVNESGAEKVKVKAQKAAEIRAAKAAAAASSVTITGTGDTGSLPEGVTPVASSQAVGYEEAIGGEQLTRGSDGLYYLNGVLATGDSSKSGSANVKYVNGVKQATFATLQNQPTGTPFSKNPADYGSIGNQTFSAEDILKASAGQGTLYSEYDINGDGKINSADAQLVLQQNNNNKSAPYLMPPEFGTGVFDPIRQQTNLDKVNQELADLYTMDRTQYDVDYQPVTELPKGVSEPAEGADVKGEGETFYNPKTGQTYTTPNSGYSVPEGGDWVKGTPEGKFNSYDLALAAKTSEQQAASLAAMGEGQQDLVSTAIKNPEDLAQKATVAKIDPDTKGAEIATSVPRDYKQVSSEEAGFTPPPADTAVTQAFEDFYNPVTGETVTVNTGGYTPPKDWVKGTPEGQFQAAGPGDAGKTTDITAKTITDGESADTPAAISAETYSADKSLTEVKDELLDVKAAEGDVTKSVTEAVGNLSEDAKPVGATMDPDFDADIAAGKRQILEGSKELSEAQGQDAEAIKTAISEGKAAAPIEAAQTTVGTKEIAKAAQIAEKDMATAEAMTMDGLADDAVAVAKKMEAFTIDDGTLAEFKEGKIEAQDTVQGQLTSLMASFDDGTPSWAAGAMRAANEAMATRGLSGSSMAAAAIVQAAMESALPIAMQDADTFRSMKLDNLGRQQQIALTNAAAQQGVKLQNFTAEQTAMLQNSQNAFSLQTQNLSNMQAAVIATAQIKASLQGKNLDNLQQANLAEAARYAEVNNLNLNNRQQAVLQDSLNNTQVSLANLSNKQQAYTTDANLAASLQGKQIDNKQQVAVLNSAKYMEANNLSFSSEEREELHNSELMTSIGLAELSNKQAATLQKAAAFAAMDMTNLSNQQQAQVENARNFLQMDLANLSNEQQVEIFKAQSIQQTILSDTAASNASKQFNASSENQTNQFMADLKSTTDRFNVTQANAIKQFNVSEENAIAKFNKEQSDSRDEFNTKNALVVAQSNALWRQSVATTDTAEQNEANMQLAKTENAFTASTLDQVWQRERDLLSYAWQADNNSLDRINSVILEDMRLDTDKSTNAATLAASERNARAAMYGQIGAAAVKGTDIFSG